MRNMAGPSSLTLCAGFGRTIPSPLPSPKLFTVTQLTDVWFADPANHRLWFLDAEGNKRVVCTGIDWPRGVPVSTDQSLLAVNDAHDKWVWSFQIQGDGSLLNGQPFYRLETPG